MEPPPSLSQSELLAQQAKAFQTASTTPIGALTTISCERCRRRKIKCDKQKPCFRCSKAGTDCSYRGSGERQRPASKRYVEALQNQVNGLEAFIKNLATADDASRHRLLSGYSLQGPQDARSPTARDVPEIGINVVPVEGGTGDGGGPGQPTTTSPDSTTSTSRANLGLLHARTREARMRKSPARHATQFYGGTSLFQIPISDRPRALAASGAQHGRILASLSAADAADSNAAAALRALRESDQNGCDGPSLRTVGSPLTVAEKATAGAGQNGPLQPSSANWVRVEGTVYSTDDETCRELMATFFQNIFQFYMFVYREYFLRDYAAGQGPYYSNMLMFSICTMGALIHPEPRYQRLSPFFARHAESLLYQSLEQPDLTTLQSLLLLGHWSVGQRQGSKGWLFCGMACRLAHEMGLHLDPNNWARTSGGSGGRKESPADREILRRVYWAAFAADKQLSLYYGRPPALYPDEADVRNAMRIPYPPEWEYLLNTYITPGISSTSYEDGIAIVGSFVHQVELSKILHRLIVDVFENRRQATAPPADEPDPGKHGHSSACAHSQNGNTPRASMAHDNHSDNGNGAANDAAAAAATATVQQIHVSLIKWLAQLPQKLYWNQWTTGKVPPYVLHLHMMFHTAMIILHRPPRQLFDDETVARGEDVEICYQSLEAILKLLKTYRRYYDFRHLPLDFVHTLSAAAGVVIMKRWFDKLSWTDNEISKRLSQILDAMAAVQTVWPCIIEVRDSILHVMAVAAAAENGNSDESGNTNGVGAGSGSGGQEAFSRDDINSMELDLDFLEYAVGGGGVGPPKSNWSATEEDVEFGMVQSSSTPSELGFLVTDDYLNKYPIC